MDIKAETAPANFNCPNCHALYKVVGIEGAAVENDFTVECLKCGHGFAPRNGVYLLKYFLVTPSA